MGHVSHEAEDVSAYITSSESRQIPVGFDGGYLRIVVVEVAIGGSNEMLGDSVAEENVGYSVLYIVNSGLIESYKKKEKGVGSVIESMMRTRKMKEDILRRMSVLSVLKFGFSRRGGRNRCMKVPANVTLVS